ncbi:MAG: hypothetical protein QXJ97_05640 [Desulfurococcaceae archaeon]
MDYEVNMNRVLIVFERWWPDGMGGVLASHLIARLLRDAGFKLTVVHGTREFEKLSGVRYVYSSFLSVRDKHRLWLNCSILTKEHWFRKLIESSDVVYVPRYCYPLIPIAKRLDKKVVVHFLQLSANILVALYCLAFWQSIKRAASFFVKGFDRGFMCQNFVVAKKRN